jgi:hypothetical protein
MFETFSSCFSDDDYVTNDNIGAKYLFTNYDQFYYEYLKLDYSPFCACVKNVNKCEHTIEAHLF